MSIYGGGLSLLLLPFVSNLILFVSYMDDQCKVNLMSISCCLWLGSFLFVFALVLYRCSRLLPRCCWLLFSRLIHSSFISASCARQENFVVSTSVLRPRFLFLARREAIDMKPFTSKYQVGKHAHLSRSNSVA